MLPAAGLALFLLAPAQSTDLFGHAACGLDDVDGDGTPDLLIGDAADLDTVWPEPREPRLAPGRVRVVSGRDGALLLERFGERAGEGFGATVAAGDLDGDGRCELVVGAEGISSFYGASVRVFGADGARRYALGLPADGLKLEWRALAGGPALAIAGDVDRDGDVDLAVGSGYDDRSGPHRGAVRIFDGPTGALLFERSGGADGDRFGTALAALGDVDADGDAELAVSAFPEQVRGADLAGAGYVEVLGVGRAAPLLRLSPKGATDTFGLSLSALDDLDGDGARELVVGEPFTERGVRAFAPATGAELRRWKPRREGPFGGALLGLPDLTGDRRPDLLVGSPESSCVAPFAWLLSGAADEVARAFFAPCGDEAYAGNLLARADDLDGDGLPEVLVGSGSLRGPNPGALRVFSGGTGRLLRLLRRADYTPAPADDGSR
jgi:hypothetical protein